MILEYLGRTVDLDKFVRHSDFIDFLDNIEPSDKVDLKDFKCKSPDESAFIKFDILTGKEKAIMSFLFALQTKKDNLHKKLRPNSITPSSILAAILMNTPPPEEKGQEFDMNVYEQYNKLYLFYGAGKRYLDILVYSRVGYDTFLEYSPDGTIWNLKDLKLSL